MEVLGAVPRWLDFVDHQYLQPEERAEPKEIAAVLGEVIEELDPTAVFLPMGLANPDHVATHDAGVLVAATRPDLAWFAYEDSGYKHIPGMLAWRVSKLFHSDLWPTPMSVPVDDRQRPQARGDRVLQVAAAAAQPRSRVERARSAATFPNSSGCWLRPRRGGSACGRCDGRPALPGFGFGRRARRRDPRRGLRRGRQRRRAGGDGRDRRRVVAVHCGDGLGCRRVHRPEHAPHRFVVGAVRAIPRSCRASDGARCVGSGARSCDELSAASHASDRDRPRRARAVHPSRSMGIRLLPVSCRATRSSATRCGR